MAVTPTFACVLKSGGDYCAKHVKALARQVEHFTTIHYKFVCYSDRRIRGVTTIPLQKNHPGWWSVPEVFRQTGPTVITGVDTIINGNIDGLFKIAMDSLENEFWMIRAINPRNDYASGVMAYNGDFSFIWKTFQLKKARRKYGKGGEQEHTKFCLREKGIRIRALQDKFYGIYSYKKNCKKRIPPDCRVMLFHGTPRPWEVKHLWRNFSSPGTNSEIPNVWDGETVFIIGGGPSLKKVDLSLLDEKNVLGVNQAVEITDCKIPYCYSGDRRWYGWNYALLKNYDGTMITSYPHFAPEDGYPTINVQRVSRHGISTRSPGVIAWNGNSGASAVNVAYWLGAKKIVLLGFDMDHNGNKYNWHNRYPEQKRNKDGFFPNPYPRFRRCWPKIAADAKRIGLEILNATEGGKLNIFPRVNLQDML